MFSGIVEELGKIGAATALKEGSRFKILAPKVSSDAQIGDSISVSGVCLTVCELDGSAFTVEAVHETLRRTNLGELKVGQSVNLERALRLSDRLGGHLVSGHVDTVAQVKAIEKEGFSRLIEFAAGHEIAPFFIEKGSVTIDGVSLTVAKLNSSSTAERDLFSFAVALIPHTLSVTTLGALKVGDRVNIEADLIGKYVARLLSPGFGEIINKGGLSLQILSEHGYT